jgi:hypothetical protein
MHEKCPKMSILIYAPFRPDAVLLIAQFLPSHILPWECGITTIHS